MIANAEIPKFIRNHPFQNVILSESLRNVNFLAYKPKHSSPRASAPVHHMNLHPNSEQTTKVLLNEYSMLKAEQNLRIAMRDHLLYAQLGTIGAIAYFALSKADHQIAMLAVPWPSIVLGWTYFSNDRKISQIRDYVALHLAPAISAQVESLDPPFKWETVHRAVIGSKWSKRLQLLIDLLCFVGTPVLSIGCFFVSSEQWCWWHILFAVAPFPFMAALATFFWIHYNEESAITP